jgi:hypothetical protein
MPQVEAHRFSMPSGPYVEARTPQVHKFQLTTQKVYFSMKTGLNILNHSLGFS